jgi:hypothetical protein
MYQIGDRVIYGGTGPDAGCRGTVTHVVGKHFEVRWDDTGETYNYEKWAGGVIRKA